MEILCRSHMLLTSMIARGDESDIQAKSTLQYMLHVMPKLVREAIEDPGIGAKGLVRNMRPVIQEINCENENIYSFPFMSFSIECRNNTGNSSGGGIQYSRKITANGWLDLSLDVMTIFVPERESLVKISYHLIARLHYAMDHQLFQVALDNVPDRLSEVLQPEERPKAGEMATFVIEFGKNSTTVSFTTINHVPILTLYSRNTLLIMLQQPYYLQDLNDALDVFKKRLNNAEERILEIRATKFSFLRNEV